MFNIIYICLRLGVNENINIHSYICNIHKYMRIYLLKKKRFNEKCHNFKGISKLTRYENYRFNYSFEFLNVIFFLYK